MTVDWDVAPENGKFDVDGITVNREEQSLIRDVHFDDDADINVFVIGGLNTICSPLDLLFGMRMSPRRIPIYWEVLLE